MTARERVARAGSIKRLGGHGGTKLTLALLDQPGACGAWVITKVFTPYGWSNSASDSLTTAMSMRGHRWQKSGLTGEGVEYRRHAAASGVLEQRPRFIEGEIALL